MYEISMTVRCMNNGEEGTFKFTGTYRTIAYCLHVAKSLIAQYEQDYDVEQVEVTITEKRRK